MSRIRRWRLRPAPFVLGIFVFAGLLSGCTAPQPDGNAGSVEAPSTDVVGLAAPYIPLVINETLVPGEVQLSNFFTDDCNFNDPRWSTIKVFSRQGFEASFEHYFEPDALGYVNRTLPIMGQAPWVVAGSLPICSSLWTSTVGGVKEGWNARFTRAEDQWKTEIIELVVPVGRQSAEAEWLPGPRVWWLIQMFTEGREGHRHGNASATDLHGNITRWDRYSIDGYDGWWYVFRLVDGPYAIRLELEQPAVVETRWTWHIDYMELSDTLCPYGFEWDVCAD